MAACSSQEIDGLQVPGIFSVDTFRSAMRYKPRPGDLFLATYPRCGTTWAGQLLVLLLQQGQPLEKPSDLHARTPYLETAGAQFLEKMQRPGAIKTHLPFHLTPWSKEAKYIYVTRNPKDCCVSYFHHLRNMPGHNFSGTFDQFFELFVSGKTDYGDYFDHLLSWYPHRNDPNVLFVTYEQLKENFDETVLRMASFIDDEKYAEPIRKQPEILENIRKHSGLKTMKEFMAKAFTDMANAPENIPLPEAMKEFLAKQKDNLASAVDGKEGGPSINQFVRKGIVGDWKNYFTEEQSRRLDEKFAKLTEGTDIPSLWKQYM